MAAFSSTPDVANARNFHIIMPKKESILISSLDGAGNLTHAASAKFSSGIQNNTPQADFKTKDVGEGAENKFRFNNGFYGLNQDTDRQSTITIQCSKDCSTCSKQHNAEDAQSDNRSKLDSKLDNCKLDDNNCCGECNDLVNPKDIATSCGSVDHSNSSLQNCDKFNPDDNNSTPSYNNEDYEFNEALRASLLESLYWDEDYYKQEEFCEKKRPEKDYSLKDTERKRWQTKGIFLIILDSLMSFLIVCPLNILFWQGLWDLLELNIFPESETMAGLTTWTIGSFVIMTLSFSQDFLKKNIKLHGKDHSTPAYQFYTYVIGFGNVSHWQGLWLLLDYHTGLGEISAWTTFLIGQFGLCAVRSFATAQAPPTSVQVDVDPNFFTHRTRFNVKRGLRIAYIADTLFSVLIVHNLMVLYWRGCWTLMDIYFYPEDDQASAAFSIILGFSLYAFSCFLQIPFNYLYRRCKSNSRCSTLCKVLLEQIMNTILNVVNVSSWRGLWYLAQMYLTVSSHPNLGYAVSHLLGIGGLMLLLCGQSVSTKGCDLDGVAPDSEGCMLPNNYFRYFEIRRKMDKQSNDNSTKASTDTESV